MRIGRTPVSRTWQKYPTGVNAAMLARVRANSSQPSDPFPYVQSIYAE
jgi:hypothetical protein